MLDKMTKLSQMIVSYSLKIERNEKVLITIENINAKPLAYELIKEINKVGATSYVKIIDDDISNYLLENATDTYINLLSNINFFEVDTYDAFIMIRYIDNDYNGLNVSSDVRKRLAIKLQDSSDIKINQKKWVLLNYPSNMAAKLAHMTNYDFFNYAFDAMNTDYLKMYEDIKPLKKLMEQTDKVRIIAPNTDITFSIKDIKVVPCCGTCNIPDGEIYTAPIKDSVNGIITYNTPCPYQGNIFHHVSLEFKDGKIIKATCDEDDERLKEIFNTDEGARYIGEFSIGLNPNILHPMGDILYDEKIIGSIHFTPGRAYKDAYNGNDSAIHWDMVLIEREEHGGGELYFDDVLIRKNGKFVLDELKHLNYKI